MVDTGRADGGPGVEMAGSVPTGRMLSRSAGALTAAADAAPAATGVTVEPRPLIRLVAGRWTEPSMMLETSDAV